MKIISKINKKNKTMLQKYNKKEFKNEEEEKKISKLLIPTSVYLLDTLTMKWYAPDIYVDKTNVEKYLKITTLFHRTSFSLCAIYKDDAITENFQNSCNIFEHSQDPYDVNDNSINYTNFVRNIASYNNNNIIEIQYLSDDDDDNDNNEKESNYIKNQNYTGNVKIHENYEACFILFGGYCAKNHVLENDIHILTCKLSHIEIDNKISPCFESDFKWQWVHPNVRTVDGNCIIQIFI
jgi:hypothetical protein